MARVILVFIVATLLSVVIQGSFQSSISYSPVAPDLLLVLVLEVALDFPGIGGLLGAFGLGLIADFATGRYIGPNAAGAVAAFYFFYFFSNRTLLGSFFAIGVFCFLGTLIKSGVSLGVLSYAGNQFVFDDHVGSYLLLESFLTALVGPLVIALLQRSAGSGLNYIRISRGKLSNRAVWGK